MNVHREHQGEEKPVSSNSPVGVSDAVGAFDRFTQRLLPLEDFPGWQAAPKFLQSVVEQEHCRQVVDVGGGANPVLSSDFVRNQNVGYCLIDISQAELDKAPAQYSSKICVDVCADSETFLSKVGRRDFDLVVSHMFLEHVKNPVQVHSNLRLLLKPGGLAVHLYPSVYNLPLALNRILPGRLTDAMLRLAQPWRGSQHGKFPAYYKMCGNRGVALRARFEALGYAVLVHTGFIGHLYYKRVPAMDQLERRLRRLLVRYGIGMTSAQLLVLKNQGDPGPREA
jgi:SAM-dependent methyltransferase